MKRKVKDLLSVPNIRKMIPIIEWEESFPDILHLTVGKRNILLCYVIRESDTVPGVALPMIRGK